MSFVVFIVKSKKIFIEGKLEEKSIKVLPMFGESYEVEVLEGEGGHGGGDPVLLQDLFGISTGDEFNRAASHVDGATSILTGICFLCI